MIYKMPRDFLTRFRLSDTQLCISDATIHRARIDEKGEESFGYFFKGFCVGYKESVRP